MLVPPPPPSDASPWPGGSDEHQQISHPTPVVAPMSPLHSDPQMSQHSHPM